tara:strand:- start:556 stop:753 length:198 start_codon:yes stop_codon:yes gene_type:complete
MKNTEISIMLFIFNALNDGWMVKKIEDNQYEFTKKKEDFNYSKNIYLDKNFLNDFITNNLKIENI